MYLKLLYVQYCTVVHVLSVHVHVLSVHTTRFHNDCCMSNGVLQQLVYPQREQSDYGEFTKPANSTGQLFLFC